jgi:putative chitinase
MSIHGLITLARLHEFAPRGKPEILAALIDGAAAIEAATIDTPRRLHHFLAQIATETGGLHTLEENLNYSAERLHQVWPARFPSVGAAVPYAHNPEALANRVYRNRLGNGSTSSGDGWRFRGGGMMQTTGRDSYRAVGREDDPEALRQPGPALASALKFWSDRAPRLNVHADHDDVVAVRRIVNGGTTGLADARKYLASAKRIFV